jgi:hypothetical protein
MRDRSRFIRPSVHRSRRLLLDANAPHAERRSPLGDTKALTAQHEAKVRGVLQCDPAALHAEGAQVGSAKRG